MFDGQARRTRRPYETTSCPRHRDTAGESKEILQPQQTWHRHTERTTRDLDDRRRSRKKERKKESAVMRRRRRGPQGGFFLLPSSCFHVYSEESEDRKRRCFFFTSSSSCWLNNFSSSSNPPQDNNTDRMPPLLSDKPFFCDLTRDLSMHSPDTYTHHSSFFSASSSSRPTPRQPFVLVTDSFSGALLSLFRDSFLLCRVVSPPTLILLNDVVFGLREDVFQIFFRQRLQRHADWQTALQLGQHVARTYTVEGTYRRQRKKKTRGRKERKENRQTARNGEGLSRKKGKKEALG